MKLTIINQTKSAVSKAFIKKWVMRVAEHVPELKGYSELTLAFVSSRQMKAMNKQYRGRDYATDVLSFEPVVFDQAGVRASARAGGKVNRPLGDLVFCLSVIRRQARQHDMTFEHELGYMIIHGILHLLGYEHETGGVKARKMFKLQDETFSKITSG